MKNKKTERFMMFSLGGNVFAFEATEVVCRIDWLLSISPIEGMPPYVIGRAVFSNGQEIVVQDLRRRILPKDTLSNRVSILLVQLPDHNLAGFMVDHDWTNYTEINKPVRLEPLSLNTPLDSCVRNMIVWQNREVDDKRKCLLLLDPQKLAQIV